MDERTKYTRRSAIVRQFVAGLADNTERQICRLYQLGFDNGAVCGKLNLGRERLEAIKRQLAVGLRQAGINLTEVR